MQPCFAQPNNAHSRAQAVCTASSPLFAKVDRRLFASLRHRDAVRNGDSLLLLSASSCTSLGSSQTLRLPHPITDAARRFCSLRATMLALPAASRPLWPKVKVTKRARPLRPAAVVRPIGRGVAHLQGSCLAGQVMKVIQQRATTGLVAALERKKACDSPNLMMPRAEPVYTQEQMSVLATYTNSPRSCAAPAAVVVTPEQGCRATADGSGASASQPLARTYERQRR